MKTPKEALRLTTQDLRQRIAWKYPQPAYVVINEVRDGTGFATQGREADALAFGVWPSRGLSVIGFEIKTHRNDWLRELKDPAKAECFARYCDAWWLVTSDGVATIDEIPATWGWYVGTSKGLKIAKEPQALTPQVLDRLFLMSIVRNVAKNYIPAQQAKEEMEARAKELMEARRTSETWELQRLREMQKRVIEFKDASGIDLENEWRFPAKETGQIVRMVTDKGLPNQIKRVHDLAKDAHELLMALQALPFFEPAESRS